MNMSQAQVGPQVPRSPLLGTCGPLRCVRPESGRRIHWQAVRRSEGYHQRIGLVYVGFETQARTPKSYCAW